MTQPPRGPQQPNGPYGQPAQQMPPLYSPHPGHAAPPPLQRRRRRSPLFAILAVVGGLLVLVAIGAIASAQRPGQGSFPSVEATATEAAAKSVPAASPSGALDSSFTKAEKRFIIAVRKDPEAAGESSNVELVQTGRLFCRLDEDPDGIYDGFGDPEITAEGIYENRELLGTLERSAVRFLCPKLIKVWKQGMAAFGDGDYVVGKDIKPGRYHTADRKIRGCYWERTTKNGATIANDFITFAAAGITVNVLASDGGFSANKNCGVWVPVL